MHTPAHDPNAHNANPGHQMPVDAEFVPLTGDELSQEEVDEIARRDVMTTNFGQQRVLLPENATRADAIYALSTRIPLNEYKLPTFFYRSDLLPYPLSFLTQDQADAAVVNLEYDEGYPTFNGPNIFWFQLPHEPMDAFLLFQRYLDQAAVHGLRQLQLLAMENNMALGKVAAFSQEFYWGMRARAYDLFQVAAERKRREVRVRRTEDTHYIQAESLFSQLQQHLGDVAPDDLWKDMTTKEKIECMRLLVNIQRISMGLSQNGNMGNKELDPMAGASGSDLMREITKNVGQGEGMGISDALRQLMSDEKFVFDAQALVIQVRHADVAAAASNAPRAIED